MTKIGKKQNKISVFKIEIETKHNEEKCISLLFGKVEYKKHMVVMNSLFRF